MNRIMATIIIPTLNAEKYFDKCLRSIEKQNQDKKNFEVLVVDGGSTDSTLSIAEKYKKKLNIQILENKHVDAESGKYIGIKKSKGEIVVLLDSDNEIVQKNWLSTGIRIFEENTKIWGIESPWLLNEKDLLINQYFTLLKIADPLARLLNPQRKPYKKYSEYSLYKLEKGAVVVTGANGFFWRKSVIQPYLNKIDKFEEVNFASRITEGGATFFAKLNNLGIYHYYCDSLLRYFSKRIKIANKFTKRKKLKQKTWLDNVPRGKVYFSILYSASLIGPTIESFLNIIRDRNIAWVYHPAISFITVMIYTYTIVKKTGFIK